MDLILIGAIGLFGAAIPVTIIAIRMLSCSLNPTPDHGELNQIAWQRIDKDLAAG
ncbi:hypothetical protein [Undibacterium sp.]|jgi:hypothetical protein|uniref:hypothetical protein n=1 Tax=Undibacterium sp. TaxID=1914977 RepID=UPI002C687B44|nr:hypothetical protein [Undibacterium sp.]HTD06311.1 hypothetical protein [Undibacterium sp.]